MLRLAACRIITLSAALVVFLVGGWSLPWGVIGRLPAHAQSTPAHKYTGVASCGASNCHGSTKPKPDYPKLNENIIWFEEDKHAQAFTTLTNEQLESGVSPSEMARNLKIAQAETSPRCLSCHALAVKKDLRGSKFDISEGVQCENCHGPAEKWLEPHAEKGWTHGQSVKVGMYDTKSLFLRAEKCVSCHLAIDHELVAAGHPDLLAFELDSFSAAEPPHWRDKGTWFGTRAWAVGQAVALREAMGQLADRARKNASQKLMAEAWEKARGHAALFRHALARVSLDARKMLDQEVAALSALLGQPGGDRGKIAATAGKVATAMNQLAATVSTKEFGKVGTKALIVAIAADAKAVSAAGLRAAEQTAMALDRLYVTYSSAPGNKEDEAVFAALDSMFATLEAPEQFDAMQFAADMKAFQKSFR